MGEILLRAALRKSLTGIQHVSPVPPHRARGLAASVYRQLERDFGLMAPPVALHSPSPTVMAACWLMLRESLVATGQVGRNTKEAVATVVSLCNACSYCVDVHSMTLEALGATEPDDPESDHRVRRVADWVRAGAKATTVELCAPFPLAHLPELVGVVLTFHYINRMVNVFLPNSPLPRLVPPTARWQVLRRIGQFMGATARTDHSPGASFDLLPAAPLPADLEWAQGNPYVSQAVSRATAAIDAAGERSVPESVRTLLPRMVAGWTGDPPDLHDVWVTEAIAGLPAGDRPAGRLAVLTALASTQLDTTTIARFREHQPDDRSFLELTSWASMVAARRISSWMTAGLRSPEACFERQVET
jgi:AhpD family alkylhydroperoxidase